MADIPATGRTEWGEDVRRRALSKRTCLCSNLPVVPLFTPALQSPIEYQRRESQTNSLGRPGGLGLGSPGRMHRAQVGTHTPINGSLPSLLLLPKGEVARAPLPLGPQVCAIQCLACRGRMGRTSVPRSPVPLVPVLLFSTAFLLCTSSYFQSLTFLPSVLTLE